MKKFNDTLGRIALGWWARLATGQPREGPTTVAAGTVYILCLLMQLVENYVELNKSVLYYWAARERAGVYGVSGALCDRRRLEASGANGPSLSEKPRWKEAR